MEIRQNDWIARWGRPGGNEGRLRRVLNSKRGRSLVVWFEGNNLSPDALAFCLVALVWPIQNMEEKFAKRPWPKRVVSKKGADRCRKAAGWLQKYGPIFDLPNADAVCAHLEEYGNILDRKYTLSTEPQLMNPTLLKEFWSRHDPARFQVIGFLTAYFVLGDDPKHRRDGSQVYRRWERIKDVLLLAGLGSSNTKAKGLATIWSNAWSNQRDEVREQLSTYLEYRYHKRWIYGDKTPEEEDVEEIQNQLEQILKGRRTGV